MNPESKPLQQPAHDIEVSTGQSRRKIGLVAYGLFFTGFSLLLISIVGEKVFGPIASAFVRDIGLLLSAIMTGTLIHEEFLRNDLVRLVGEALERILNNHVPPIELSSEVIAKKVHKTFCESPPGMTGLRLMSEARRGLPQYYEWVNEHKPQELFFGGRSVLHRIDADIRTNTHGATAERVLLRRLKEGSKIYIVFLDPRTNLLERLAREEGQLPLEMLKDIATSIGIANRLFELLRKHHEELQPASELIIRVYDRVPYFAFHKQDDEIIVGFYFLSSRGYTSAAYELIDNQTKQVFGNNFSQILAESSATSLVEFDGSRGHAIINEKFVAELRQFLVGLLGEEKVDQLLNRT